MSTGTPAPDRRLQQLIDEYGWDTIHDMVTRMRPRRETVVLNPGTDHNLLNGHAAHYHLDRDTQDEHWTCPTCTWHLVRRNL